MTSKAVPALQRAAIQQIADPQARQVVQAIADGLAVRNGDVGNGDNAFLTLADLKEDKSRARAVANALIGPTSAMQPGSPMFDLAANLEQRILGSPEWLALFARITLLDAPDTAPGSVAYRLLQEARSRGAAITEVNTKLQTEAESLAQRIETVTAATEENAAAISEETTARTTADTAEATRLTTFITQTAGSIAGLQADISIKTNSDNALAQAVNKLWAEIGNNQALVASGTQVILNNTGSSSTKFDQLQATVGGVAGTTAALRSEFNVTNSIVNGMAGNWSLKLDLNGYVSGLSLNASVDTANRTKSSFLVLADTFAIGAPGKPNIVPFAVDAQTGLVSIRGDVVARGSITANQLSAYSVDRSKLALKAVGGAQIDDLAVDTLKIAGSSVTVGVYDSSGGATVGPGGSTTMISRTIDLGDGYNTGVIVSGVVGLHADADASYGVRVLVNGSVAGDMRASLHGGYVSLAPVTGFARSTGRYASVQLQVYNVSSGPGGNVSLNVHGANISIMGGKR